MDRCQTVFFVDEMVVESESRAILDGYLEAVHNYTEKCIIMQST